MELKKDLFLTSSVDVCAFSCGVVVVLLKPTLFECAHCSKYLRAHVDYQESTNLAFSYCHSESEWKICGKEER